MLDGDLPASIDAPRGTSHEFNIVIVTLALFDLVDHILDVSEPVSLSEFEQDSAI